MKAYPEYKASGIDWLGDIPSHWKTIKSSYIFDNIGSGTTPTAGEDLYYEYGSINWLQTGDLNDGVINSTSKKITPFAVESRNLRFYDKGSVVIAMYGATIAKLGLLDIRTTVNQACCVLTPSTFINSKYAFYFFYSAKNELISLASGGGQPNISQATISNFKLPVPTISEQEVIAAYLDDVTGKVDALIAEKQKQVEDIRAYRTSLITETVTRGLNPDTPLRPSGIDWLGDIPQHWEIIKSSYVFDNIGSGTTPTSGEELYYEGGSVNWLQTGDLNDGVINSTSKKITPFAVESKNLKFYNKGSVVIAMYGATIAKLGLLNIQTTVNQACCVLTPSTNIYSKYAFYCFYSAKNELISLASGGGQPNISQATISDFKLPVPPLAEQQSIADFLDAKTAKIDELISELTKQIDELTEYKQAVITEAVTGKVDVRDYKPSN